jgi:hypothetical protein
MAALNSPLTVWSLGLERWLKFWEILGYNKGRQENVKVFPRKRKKVKLTVPFPHLLTCWIRWDSALTETTPAMRAAATAMDFKENIEYSGR